MDIYDEIDLGDCPVCGGAGLVEEEAGQSCYIVCCDCGAHTADIPFVSDNDRLTAAEMAAHLWNIGKVLSMNPGD